MKKTIIILAVIILAGIGAYFLMQNSSDDSGVTENQDTTTDTTKPQDGAQTPVAQERKAEEIVGKSVQGRDITAYHFGTGSKEILFVGGIHGGYSRNTAAVAYEAIDLFKKNPSLIPSGVSVTVIPVVNPDGLNKVAGSSAPSDTARIAARFNANNVDLNRNFDCDWQSSGKWQSRTVSGGSTVFSEPEAQAVRDYIAKYKPSAAVIWYSAAGGVFSSSCGAGVLPETRTITNTFAKAAGYPSFETFDYYEITGDMANWLAKQSVPAISVLLTNYDDTEWVKNKAGIEALLSYYAK